MGSRGNLYGSVTAAKIVSDLLGGELLNTEGESYIRYRSTLPYYDPYTSPYHLEYAGHNLYAAKIVRYGVDVIYDGQHYETIYTYHSSEYLGLFNSFDERKTAITTALGYDYGDIFDDYYYRAAVLVYGATIPYYNIWEVTSETNGNLVGAVKPDYMSLLSGYYLDTRSLPKIIEITPTKTKTLKLGYYSGNPYEPIAGLASIDWLHYSVNLIKGKPIKLPINNPAFGTLWVDDLEVESIIRAMPNTALEYPVRAYFPDEVPILFAGWNVLYNAENSKSLPSGSGSLIAIIETHQTSSTLRILGANNNAWDNGLIVGDLGTNLNHPMFAVDNERAYDWHVKPQSDGSNGTLIMDSIRTIETHRLVQLIGKALNVFKFAVNTIDETIDRVSNLGWYVENIARVLGIRADANGQINIESEKKITRKILKTGEEVDQTKYSGNSFGSEGMLVRRLPNYFDKNTIKSGGIVGIHDLPQLMLEILDQINLGIGLQESGAIEINHGGTVHRYPSLLALVTEIAVHQFSQSSYAKSTHISSLVTQEQTKEIISGLGLPTVSKTLLRTANGNKAAIPYWGIAPQASLAKRIDTCTYNVGIVLGQLL
jgi:hypothetical protein